MAQAFGAPAFPVDTHIHRLAGALGAVRRHARRADRARSQGGLPRGDVGTPPPADHLLRPRVLPCAAPRLRRLPDLLVGGGEEARDRRSPESDGARRRLTSAARSKSAPRRRSRCRGTGVRSRSRKFSAAAGDEVAGNDGCSPVAGRQVERLPQSMQVISSIGSNTSGMMRLEPVAMCAVAAGESAGPLDREADLRQICPPTTDKARGRCVQLARLAPAPAPPCCVCESLRGSGSARHSRSFLRGQSVCIRILERERAAPRAPCERVSPDSGLEDVAHVWSWLHARDARCGSSMLILALPIRGTSSRRGSLLQKSYCRSSWP